MKSFVPLVEEFKTVLLVLKYSVQGSTKKNPLDINPVHVATLGN